jgi:glutamate racemase
MPMRPFSTPIRRLPPSALTIYGDRPGSSGAPIGLFDSGVGGLTVARALAQRLPKERLLYIADQAHVPYGGRPLPEIEGFAASLTGHLCEAGAKVVVMACNISSATAMGPVRRALGRGRVYGMIEAGARAALRQSRGRIGVLATQGTVNTGAYPLALGEATVTQVACPRFVPLIEAGLMGSAEARAAATESLIPLFEAQVDTIILGCTHYPLLLADLSAAALALGVRPHFVDPADELAVELESALARDGLLAGQTSGPHLFATTGPLRTFMAQRATFTSGLEGRGLELHWDPVESATKPRP